MPNKQLRNELNRFSNKTEQPLRLYSGALGIYIGGKQYVDVPNRPGFVYVRLSSNISELIQAHNQVVSPIYDLPVLLTKTKSYYEIFGRDVEQYASYDTSNSSFLPKHGFQHEFDPDNGGGGDLVFVHGEQFYPLMGFPSGTDGAGNILIAPYRYYANSAWHYTGNTGTPDLLQYKPTGSANAVLLLVGLTVNTGNPFVKIGTEFAASITGASALTDYVPTSLTVSNEIPGTIVRLVTGTDTITWANIYDARQYMGILQAAGASTFLNLTDTPSSYSGQANKAVTVKPDESGLEFVTTITGSTTGGGFTDGIQETFYPTIVVSGYTGSSAHVGTYYPYSGTYYQFNFVPGNVLTTLYSSDLVVGNNQPAFVWATESTYNLKEWLLRGEYTLFLGMAKQAGAHPMTAYCQLWYHSQGTTEQLVATSSLAKDYAGLTDIIDDGTGFTWYAFRMQLDSTAYTLDGPIQALDNGNPSRLVVKVIVNAASGGTNGYLSVSPGPRDFFNVNLQRQVLDNHYFPISGTFLQLSDTPNSYSGQGSKYVAVKSDASGLEFVTAPAGGGGGSSILVYDDSVFKVTGTSISFDSNLSVAVTGSVAYVSSSGGASISIGAIASLPVSGTNVGDTYRCTDSLYEFVWTGSIWQAYIYGIPVTVPPLTGWTWSNSGTSSVDVTNGYPYVVFAAAGSDIERAYMRPFPTGTFTLEMGIQTQFVTSSAGRQEAASLMIYDGTKLIEFGLFAYSGQAVSSRWRTLKWTNPNSALSIYTDWVVSETLAYMSSNIMFLKVVVDATNFTWYMSLDKFHWVQFDQRAKSDYLGTPTYIGFGGYSNTGKTISLLHWNGVS